MLVVMIVLVLVVVVLVVSRAIGVDIVHGSQIKDLVLICPKVHEMILPKMIL